jgi:hypothetical protein
VSSAAGDRLRELVPTLLDRSRKGQMEWKPLAAGDTSAFVHRVASGTTLVVRNYGPIYQLSLHNPAGAQVDTYTETSEGPIRTLWQLLRDRSLGTDDAFDQLKKDLGL